MEGPGWTSRQWRAVAAGVALGLAVGWNSTNIGAAADGLAHAYGTTLTVVGLLTTAFLATQMLLILPAGMAVDRVGAKVVGVAGLAVMTIGNALALLEPSAALAIGARLLVGCGAAGVAQAGVIVVRSEGELGEGIQGSAQVAAAGLALAIVPLVADAVEWRAPYVTGGLLSVLAIPAVLQKRHFDAPEAGASPREQLRAMGQTARDPRIRQYAIVFGVSVGLGTAVGNWIVPLLDRTPDFSHHLAGVVGGMIFLCGIFSRPAAGGLVEERRRLERPLLAAAMAVVAVCLVLISATLAVPIAIGAVLVFGIANGVPYAPMLAAAVRERPDNPGEALAILGVANLLVAMTAVPLMGAGFTPEAPEYAFLACAAVFLLALIPIARMRTIAKPKP